MTNFLLGKVRRIYFMALPENKLDLKKSRVCYTIGDSAAQTIVQLAGGTFIVALMSSIGISDANIGILTSLASLAALFQLFTMRFVSKLKKYKFFVCFTVMQKFFLALIYMVPLLSFSMEAKIIWVVGGYFLAQIWTQIGTPTTQDWIASLVPSRVRGRYFAIKDSVAVFIVVSVMLVAGIILDHFKKEDIKIGFVIISVMILVLALINLIAFSMMKEPRVSIIDENGYEMHGNLAKRAKQEKLEELEELKKQGVSEGQKENIITEIKDAFTFPLFRKALLLNLLWMSCFYIAAPFNASYQIKELSLPYTFIMIVNFVVNMIRIYISPKVGKLADRFGMARIFKYFLLGLMLNYILTSFSLPGNAYIMMPIASLCSSVGWAFIGIGLFGIQLEFLDAKKRMMQLTILSSISGVYGFLISFVGGKILEFLQHNRPVFFGRELYAQQILNMVGAIMIIITFMYTKFRIQTIKVKANSSDGSMKNI